MKQLIGILFFVFIGLPAGLLIYFIAKIYFEINPSSYKRFDTDHDESNIRQSQYTIENLNQSL